MTQGIPPEAATSDRVSPELFVICVCVCVFMRTHPRAAASQESGPRSESDHVARWSGF